MDTTEFCPMGRCRAWQPNSFSRNGTEGIDCSNALISRQKCYDMAHTPPSRIRKGSAPHTSWTAHSRDWNQESPRSPSHQSALWSTEIYIIMSSDQARSAIIHTFNVLGDLILLNVSFKNSFNNSASPSSSWSGTMRKDNCALTAPGITVASNKSCQHLDISSELTDFLVQYFLCCEWSKRGLTSKKKEGQKVVE